MTEAAELAARVLEQRECELQTSQEAGLALLSSVQKTLLTAPPLLATETVTRTMTRTRTMTETE